MSNNKSYVQTSDWDSWIRTSASENQSPPALPLGYIPNDVADESRAVSHHLPQTHPHPDYITTTVLLDSGDGVSLPSILGEKDSA